MIDGSLIRHDTVRNCFCIAP